MTSRALTLLIPLFPLTMLGGSPCDTIPWSVGFAASAQGNTVLFTDQSNTAGYAANYSWHFGDGASSDQTDPVHTYNLPGNYLVCLYVEIGPNNGADSCFAAFCDTISVGDPSPCDDLDPGFSLLTQGQVVLFNNYVDDPTWGYHWTFGDGTEEWVTDPVHTYIQPGTYQACLTVWAWDANLQDTCFADTCHLVVITAGSDPCDSLQACFMPDYQGANVFSFANCSTTPDPGQTSFYWIFGDGSTSTAPSPTHSFPQGVWTVCLWTTWQNCADSTCQVITAGNANPCDTIPWSVGFAASAQGNTVLFADQSNTAGYAANYSWHFGDGASSDQTDPVHTYNLPGNYLVCLYVEIGPNNGVDSCFAAFCDTISVGDPSPCDDLDPGFSVLTQGQVVLFNNYVDDPTWGYHWTFGDGTEDWVPDPVHTYTQPGTYQACLTVWAWDANLQDTCFADTCHPVVVTAGGTPCDTTFTVQFTWSDQGNGVVEMEATASLPANGFIWDFGDGTQGGGQNVSHTFGQPGNYTICAIAWYWTGADTCWAMDCALVPIGTTDPCDGVLNAAFGWTGQGAITTFFNYSTTNGLSPSYFWDFGDGQWSTDTQPAHTYPDTAQYLVCLSVWALNDNVVCADTLCQWVVPEGTGPASLHELHGDTWTLYPNPTSGNVEIGKPGAFGPVEVRIRDILGRSLFTASLASSDRIVIPLARFDPGSYLVEVTSAGGAHVFRVVRQ
ncbi:MAG: PKD domain-containing protein [Flavobacteriales bacterium]|nr:PKD domain-containing protein [Flavobacteriales bacterium]